MSRCVGPAPSSLLGCLRRGARGHGGRERGGGGAACNTWKISSVKFLLSLLSVLPPDRLGLQKWPSSPDGPELSQLAVA